MDIAAYIFLGLAGVVLLIWLISEIQIRVWMRYGERFLLRKSNKLKKQEDEKNKEQFSKQSN